MPVQVGRHEEVESRHHGPHREGGGQGFGAVQPVALAVVAQGGIHLVDAGVFQAGELAGQAHQVGMDCQGDPVGGWFAEELFQGRVAQEVPAQGAQQPGNVVAGRLDRAGGPRVGLGAGWTTGAVHGLEDTSTRQGWEGAGRPGRFSPGAGAGPGQTPQERGGWPGGGPRGALDSPGPPGRSGGRRPKPAVSGGKVWSGGLDGG